MGATRWTITGVGLALAALGLPVSSLNTPPSLGKAAVFVGLAMFFWGIWPGLFSLAQKLRRLRIRNPIFLREEAPYPTDIIFNEHPHEGSGDPDLSILHVRIVAEQDFGEAQFHPYLIFQRFCGDPSGEVALRWQSASSSKGESDVRLERNTPRLVPLFKRRSGGDAYLMHANYMVGSEGPRRLDPGAYIFRIRLRAKDIPGKVWESGRYLLNIPSSPEDNGNFSFGAVV